jgi:hypothetical protein
MPPKQKGALKEKELLPRVYKKTDDVKPRDISEIYHISDEVCGESKYYTTIFVLRKIAKIHWPDQPYSTELVPSPISKIVTIFLQIIFGNFTYDPSIWILLL